MNERELLEHIRHDAEYVESFLESLAYVRYNRHNWYEEEARQRIADKFNGTEV